MERLLSGRNSTLEGQSNRPSLLNMLREAPERAKLFARRKSGTDRAIEEEAQREEARNVLRSKIRHENSQLDFNYHSNRFSEYPQEDFESRYPMQVVLDLRRDDERAAGVTSSVGEVSALAQDLSGDLLLGSRRESSKAVGVRDDDQINELETPLGKYLGLFRLSEESISASQERSFQGPWRRGRDNDSHFESDLNTPPPSPSPTPYQCEYPGMQTHWKTEKWTPEQKQEWQQGVEATASRIDQTPEHHMSYRLAEEIQALVSILENSLRYSDTEASFRSVKAELCDAIEEAKKDLKAEMDESRCHCHVADMEKKEVSPEIRKEEGEHTV